MKPRLVCGLMTFWLLAACAAAPPPQPQAKPSASSEAKQPARPPAAPPPSQAEPKITRQPSEILLLPDQMYSLSFASSEAGAKAEQTCGKRHKDNPKKKNQCMKLERAKIKDDVLHFAKDAKGYLFWTTSEQRGNLLKRRKKVGFKITKETENSVELRVKGMAKPVTIGVPNDYSIEVPNPKHGKLVYEAKVDIATDD